MRSEFRIQEGTGGEGGQGRVSGDVLLSSALVFAFDFSTIALIRFSRLSRYVNAVFFVSRCILLVTVDRVLSASGAGAVSVRACVVFVVLATGSAGHAIHTLLECDDECVSVCA